MLTKWCCSENRAARSSHVIERSRLPHGSKPAATATPAIRIEKRRYKPMENLIDRLTDCSFEFGREGWGMLAQAGNCRRLDSEAGPAACSEPLRA